ncbi:MAG: hypothetical protein H6Q70_2050 [Firmicutes bacterium]|nr:hypothetical protein [Bacillota bacterium]
MKKSVHILGLPIISITEGKELGISKSLVIDAAKGMITALVIEIGNRRCKRNDYCFSY